MKDGLTGQVWSRQVVDREGNFELREQQVAYHRNERNDWNLIEWDEKPLNSYFRGRKCWFKGGLGLDFEFNRNEIGLLVALPQTLNCDPVTHNAALFSKYGGL